MVLKETFQQLTLDFIEKDLGFVRSRDQEIPIDVPKIVSLLGPRRAGKTYMLFHVAKQLRKVISADRIVYLNFEDDRLYPMVLEDMNRFLEAYYELFPKNKHETVYFLFDEIQVVENWELFIRRVSDSENSRIYLTGSSSKLLSREIATSLRGRTLSFEVFPLSFKEFLDFQEISASPFSSEGRAVHVHQLRKYLEQGGFPELIFLDERFHRKTIKEYMDLMVYRDLAERFQIRNPALIKYLLRYMLVNLANPLSLRKAYNDLVSQGYKIGKNSVYEYFSHLEEAYILFQVKIRSQSPRKQTLNPIKVYGIDPAFKMQVSLQTDTGRLLENLVYLQLRRGEEEISYWRGDQEVDFITDSLLINVSETIQSPATRAREITGLTEAMNSLDRDQAYLLTLDEEEVIENKGRTILVKPVWKWLLGA